jgi:hypothetical protein
MNAGFEDALRLDELLEQHQVFPLSFFFWLKKTHFFVE